MTDQDEFHGLWADAVAEYEKQTDRRMDKDARFREFLTVEDFETAVDEESERFASFRNEHRKLFSTMARCIKPLIPMIEIIQKGIGNTPYQPVCAFFGAATYLLQACASVTKAYDGVEELFEQISDITARLKEYEFESIETSLKMKMTSILAFILDIIGRAESCIRRKRIKQWARSVFLREDGISASVAKLQRYVETELGLVIALTYGRVKGLQLTTTEVQADVKTVKSAVEDVVGAQRSDRQRALSEADEKKLADALKTASYDEIAREHASNIEKLTKGTGDWIRGDIMFQAWEQESAPILWVFGKPGVGKTMLAARTIETLHNKYPQHSDIPSLTSVSYIYFKDGDPALRDCAQLWKAAALQTAKANDRFKKHVLAVIDKKQDTFASALRIWQQLFLDFFTENSTSQSLTSLAYIIVDGLDEGPEAERVRFLTCLAELVNRTTIDRKCRIQVAVFARPDVRADPGFEKVGVRRQERIIEVTPERNTEDIEAFIRQRLGDVKILKFLKKRKATKEWQTLARQIYTSVLNRAQGMFLWASLVFDQIWDSPSSEAITQSLGDAPEGLDAMLHHIFKRLEIEEAMHRSYFVDLLSWVFCTYRPLYISELFVLLLITAKQQCYMVEDDLRGRYSSLFDVAGPAPDESDSDEEETVEHTGEEVPESDVDDFDFLNRAESTGVSEDEDESEETGQSDQESEPSADQDGLTTPIQQEIDETAFKMPSRWYQTTVTFSHARIRDYLTTEMDPSTRRWHDCSTVPDNMNIRHLIIALAFIDVLRTGITDQYSVQTLETYAQKNWMKHLLEVDFTKVDKELGTKMAQMLSTLFHDGGALLASASGVWNSFIRTWFCTKEYSSLVRKIITEHISDLNENEREWALLVKDSARALFQPLVTASARTWLTKTGWDDYAYLDKSEREVWILYAFSTLDDNGNNVASVDTFNVEWGMWNIPLETIEEIANLESIPKTAHWYAGVAWILMEADETLYTDRAVEYFQKALEMKPGGWMPMEGLARCYGENLHQYQTAIDWMKAAIVNLPEELGISFLLEARISDWELQLGQDQNAVESARTAYKNSRGFSYGTGTASDPSILRTIRHYIAALYKTKDYSTIKKLLYDLASTKTVEPNRSLWTAFLQEQYDNYYRIDIFDKVGTIVRATNDDDLRDFMKESIKQAVDLNSDTIAEAQTVWLATQSADWQYHYAREPEESIDLYENIVTLIDQSNEVTQHSHNSYRTWAASQLSSMYFEEAKIAFNEGADYSTPVSKMENLAMHKQGSKRYYRASYPALILGLWLHEYAKADEETWKAAIKPSVKQGLYLLSDDDPWNDQRAYCQLGRALLLAGDVLNASIALGITTKPIEDKQLADFEAKAAEKESSGGFSDAEVIPSAAEIRNLDQDAALEDTIGVPSQISQFDKPRQGQELEVEEEEVENEEEGEEDKDEGEGEEEELEEDEYEDEEREEEAQENFNPKYAGFYANWECDGPCTTASDSYQELHFCRFCDDTCFCEKCIELVKSDKMPFRKCAADHQHVRMFPMTSEAKRVTTALVERRFEVQQEWLDGLKKEWQD